MPPKKSKAVPAAVPDVPRPPGRPSTYRPEHCPALEDHMEKGYSFESFAGTIGVHRDTLYAWEKSHIEFSDAKKVGIEKGRLFWERLSILAAAGKIKGFNATVWIFTMKNRFEWRDKVEHSGDDAKPIRVIVEEYQPK